MKYIELVGLYEAIGATMKRLEITRYIVDFLKKISGLSVKDDRANRRSNSRRAYGQLKRIN